MSLSKLSPTLSTKDLFLKACDQGNLGLVRELLALGADVNWRGELENWQLHKGVSGLLLATRGGHEDLLDLLLSQPGVEVNIKSDYSQTPLMVACLIGKENIVRRLLQVPGIQLNCQDNCTWSALHLAVVCGRSGCVQQLRGAPGLDWNIKECSGLTPLLMAADLGKAECLQVFLIVPQPYLDLTSTDRNGYNVAWLAVKGSVRSGDRLRCVELLSRDPRVDWNTRDQAGDTPLLFCLKKNRIGLAKILLDNPRVSLDVRALTGNTRRTSPGKSFSIFPLCFSLLTLTMQGAESPRDPGSHVDWRSHQGEVV